MNFKHEDFFSSETMRSLERLAREKGLIKNNVLEKIASGPKKSKVDLTPTNNLTENLLKLCSGLRNAGMEKYAEELESTFMMYKQASTICDSDLVDQAHPDGSPSLEGVDGDAVIETILDQQLAMIRMVDKKPTGKLTNAKSIIDAVKISLAETESNEIVDLQRKIAKKLQRTYDIIANFISLANKDLTMQINHGGLLILIENTQNNPTKEGLIRINQLIDSLARRVKPSWLGEGVEKSTWETIGGMPDAAKQSVNESIDFMNNIIEIRRQKIESEYAEKPPKDESDPGKEYGTRIEETAPEFEPIKKEINALIRSLKSYQPMIDLMENKTDVAEGTQYISDSIKKLESYLYQMSQIDPEFAGRYAPKLTQMVQTISEDVNGFYNDWIA